MDQQRRLILRAAIWLQSQYERRQQEMQHLGGSSLHELLQPYLNETFRQERRLRAAQSNNLSLVVARLQARCKRALDRAIGHFEELRHRLQEPLTHVPALRDLFEELCAAKSDWGGLEVNRAERRISVTTDPIELEGIYLGPFRIDLFPAEIGSRDPRCWFAVEALDPNPAASNDNVTHPHVDSGRLCPGNADQPIYRALTDGRLSEFFTLVRSVLETYNPDSPFVSLDSWCGTPCADCGYIASDDDRYWCEGCEQDYCSECISSCQCCDATYCTGCLSRCHICEESVCESCLSACNECGEQCCCACLEDGLCPSCHEEKEQTIDQEEDEPNRNDQTGRREEAA